MQSNNIQQHRKLNKKRLGNPDLVYTLREGYELENAVMFIPIDDKHQIHIHQYKQWIEPIDGKHRQCIRFIDIREYKLHSGKFIPTDKAVRFDISYLEQLTIRLQALLGKKKDWGLTL